MTDRTDALERLARLQERRSSSAVAAGPDAPVEPRPSPEAAARRSPRARRGPRRRRPATASKIVTVGASVTAVLAMMALYGAAGRASGTPSSPTGSGAATTERSSPAPAATTQEPSGGGNTPTVSGTVAPTPGDVTVDLAVPAPSQPSTSPTRVPVTVAQTRGS